MAILDEIFGKPKVGFTMRELTEVPPVKPAKLDDFRAKGHLDTYSLTVGTEWKSIVPAWMSCVIHNDGDADVYIRFNDKEGNPWEMGEAPLKSGESLPIDLEGRRKDGGSPVIWLICQAGTADIRIFSLL